MSHYIIDSFLKHAEQDDWEQGCLPETAQVSDCDIVLKADTIEALVTRCMCFVGCNNPSQVILNACGEAGRIDIQVYESSEGLPCTPHHLDLWRDGEATVWLVTYTGYLQEVRDIPFPDNDAFENQLK